MGRETTVLSRRHALKGAVAAPLLLALPDGVDPPTALAHQDPDEQGPLLRLDPQAVRALELARYLGLGARDISQKAGIPLAEMRDWYLGLESLDGRHIGRLGNVLGPAHPNGPAGAACYFLGLNARWPYGHGVIERPAGARRCDDAS